MLRRLTVRFTLWLAVIAALLFWSAGTFAWWGAWVFLAEIALGGTVICLWLLRHNPDLLRERLARGFQKGQVFWDKVFVAVMSLASCGWIVLMGFDVKRWGLSDMRQELGYAGAVLIAICFLVSWLVFRENPFAAPVVKIQGGQTVVTTGPYRIVRHPMYVGSILYICGLPLLLGSWIGLACAPLLVIALMIRIGIEERALRKDLAGYSEYAARVRYRLLPYVW
jgi:protein-S-isoprenylcysteine O-methyltransferase Ste14